MPPLDPVNLDVAVRMRGVEELLGLDVFEVSLVGEGDNPPAQVCLIKNRRNTMSEQKKDQETKAKAAEVKAAFDFNALSTQIEGVASLVAGAPPEDLPAIMALLAAKLPKAPEATEVEAMAMESKMERPSDDSGERPGDKPLPPPPPQPQKKPDESSWASKEREREAAVKAAEARSKALEAKVAALEAAAEHSEYVAKARSEYPDIGGDHEAIAKALRAADHSLPIDPTLLRSLAARCQELAKAAGITVAKGSSASGDTSPFGRERQLVAAKMKAKPTLSEPEARAEVHRENPSLYSELRKG